MNISHYLGDYTALTTTRFGDKIYVDTRDTSLAPHLLVEGDWEPWVTKLMGPMLMEQPTALFIDVGANFGWYSLLAARFGPARTVVSLEPHPRLFELLSKTITVNGLERRVRLTQRAASSSTGELQIFSSVTELGGSTVAPLLPRPPDPKSIVLADTLDRLTFPYWSADVPPIIKLDVEGYEAEVLRGARGLLELRPTLFLEHHSRLVGDYWELLHKTHTLQEIRHSSHLGPELDIDGLRTVGDAETLLCRPRNPNV